MWFYGENCLLCYLSYDLLILSCLNNKNVDLLKYNEQTIFVIMFLVDFFIIRILANCNKVFTLLSELLTWKSHVNKHNFMNSTFNFHK